MRERDTQKGLRAPCLSVFARKALARLVTVHGARSLYSVLNFHFFHRFFERSVIPHLLDPAAMQTVGHQIFNDTLDNVDTLNQIQSNSIKFNQIQSN